MVTYFYYYFTVSFIYEIYSYTETIFLQKIFLGISELISKNVLVYIPTDFSLSVPNGLLNCNLANSG
jgi:hypothetical protein